MAFTPDNSNSGDSSIPDIVDIDTLFLSNLNGVSGSYKNETKVKVRGSDDNYFVYKSFPVLTAENTFTICYILNNAVDVSKGLLCPEMFCYLADNPEDININLDNSYDRFTLFSADLKGSLGSYPTDSLVKTKFSDRIYKVVLSFLMINSDNSSIICYQLTDLKNKTVLYCPHSFLTRLFEL